jgi:hypothetical protein
MEIVKVPGSRMIQEDLPNGNFIVSDQDEVLYAPNPNEVMEQDAYFYFTCAPPIHKNFTFNYIKLTQIRSYYDATPLIFNLAFHIEGVTVDGTLDLLAEYVTSEITGTLVTSNVFFQLGFGKSQPMVVKTGVGVSSSGTVRVVPPKRWLNYDDIVLKVTISGTPYYISPTSPSEDSSYLTYTLPGGWVEGSTACLQVTEVGQTMFETNDIPLYDKDQLHLGVNGIDKYPALRLGVYLQADKNVNVRLSGLEYAYEVI